MLSEYEKMHKSLMKSGSTNNTTTTGLDSHRRRS